MVAGQYRLDDRTHGRDDSRIGKPEVLLIRRLPIPREIRCPAQSFEHLEFRQPGDILSVDSGPDVEGICLGEWLPIVACSLVDAARIAQVAANRRPRGAASTCRAVSMPTNLPRRPPCQTCPEAEKRWGAI